MQIRRRFAHRRGVQPKRAKKDSHEESVEIRAHMRTQTRGHPQKEAVSGSFSEQDDKRFRFRLGRPRAEAHGWGRVARILTEINRLPQFIPVLPTQNPLKSGRLQVASQLGRAVLLLARSCFYKLDAIWGRNDARFTPRGGSLEPAQ